MNERRAMCTIIAKNYLAFARTLVESFLDFHPDHKCYVLIVDDFEGYVNSFDERFETVNLTDLGISNLPSFCFKYSVKELCTAAKAHLLEYLIREKSVDRLLYLDPDILVTGPLDGIYEKLASYDIVLTPHLDRDYPDDGLLPDDGHILRAGIYNLGFIGVNSSENSGAFLNWWQPKLDQHCVVDLLNGYFVDQKFIDLAPLFFGNIFFERNVGYNAAYWNLHSRQFTKTDGAWNCNQGPLYFFHFSGYSPESALVSVHVPSKARYRLSNRRDLRPLFSEYKKLLIKNGYQQAINWPYTFGYFKTGEVIPDHLRVYYRNTPREWRRNGDPFASNSLKRRVGINPKSKIRAATTIKQPQTTQPTELLTPLTSAAQLEAILNSRAWRWVCRYGRFKNRYLKPVYEFLRR